MEEFLDIEEWMNAIVDKSIFCVDCVGIITLWNDTSEALTGHPSVSMMQKPLISVLSDSGKDIFSNLLTIESSSEICVDLITKREDILSLKITASVRRNPKNGAFLGFFCFAEEQGKIIHSEIKLNDDTAIERESTNATTFSTLSELCEETKLLIDQSNCPMFTLDLNGNINEWNEKIAQLTGMAKQDVLNYNFVERFVMPSSFRVAIDAFSDVLQGHGVCSEIEIHDVKGNILFLSLNASPRRSKDGLLFGIFCVVHDLTERLQHERAVEVTARELRQLVDTANAPIFGVNCDGLVNEWNKKTAEITGYSKEEAFHEPLIEKFIAPEMRSQVQHVMDEALIGRGRSNYELKMVSRSGDEIILVVNATTRRDANENIVGVVGVAQDVSEDRKHAKELREMQYIRASQVAKIETERNMTAYFAHELRNPLGAIDSALNAMPDNLPEGASSLIHGMKLCSNFMSSIMNNLLDVRKMEEGKMTLKPTPISLSLLLDNVYKMLLPSIRPSVQFLKVCETKGKNWVLSDSHRTHQVLTNVTANAIKYTTSGSIILSFRWEGKYIVFECEDTGPGIPKNEQEKLFERYVQRGGAPGTGLGLAIAKHLVDLMDGTIRFESDPTVKPGTKCIVKMPLQECEEVQIKKKDDKVIESGLFMLIIDDVQMNRSMLKRRMKKSIAPNAVIKEASTGEEALLMCGNEKFDVIVVDQFMEEAGGVMVGTDVIFAMRRMRFESVIIGCSGNDMEEQFIEAGADIAWKKPLPSNSKMIADIRLGMINRKARMLK